MTLERGEYLAASGIMSLPHKEPWGGYIETAAREVGKSCESEYQRKRLVDAVKKNVLNRKRYPYKILAARFGLTVSESQFHIEKQRFVRCLGELAGWI